MARKQVGVAPSGATDAATKAYVDSSPGFGALGFDPFSSGIYLESGRLVMNDGAVPTSLGVEAFGVYGSTAGVTVTANRNAGFQHAAKFKGYEYRPPSAATDAVSSIDCPLQLDRVAAEVAIRFQIAVDSGSAGRFRAGLRAGSFGSLDNEPSADTDWIGIGWDTADSNVHLIRANSGGSQKIDLGVPFTTGGMYMVHDLLLIGTATGYRYVYRGSNPNPITVDGTAAELTDWIPGGGFDLSFAAKASAGGVNNQPKMRLLGFSYGYGRRPGA